MAKQRSEDPDSNPMDNISIEDTPQAQDYVEVKRGGAKPSRKVKPAIIPGGAFSEQMVNAGTIPSAEIYTSPLTSKETRFIPATDAAVRTHNYKNVKAPIIAGVDRSTVISCDWAGPTSGPDAHDNQGFATHAVNLPRTPREGVEVYCPKHLAMAKAQATKSGDRINVRRLKSSDVAAIKTLRRMQTQENLAAGDISVHTLNPNLPEEEKIIGESVYKKEKDKPSPIEPSMSTPSDPNWDPSGYTKVDRSNDPNYDLKLMRGDTGRLYKTYVRRYNLPKRTTKIEMGNVEATKESPELSDEEISRLDPATRAYIKDRRSRGISAKGPESAVGSYGMSVFPYTPQDTAVNQGRMKSWEDYNALDAAFDRLSEEHEPHVQAEIEMTKQASKQRRIEMAKRNPSFRVGLEMDARKALQNKPKELE